MTSQVRRVQLVVVGALLATFGIAPRLWLQHPLFAPIPITQGFPTLPPPMDALVLGILVLLLVIIPFVREPRWWIVSWCVLLALRTFWDRVTWQPYLLQYSFMLFSIALARRRPDSRSPVGTDGGAAVDPSCRVLEANRLIVAAVYFWSGVSKFGYANMVEMPRRVAEFMPAWLPVGLITSLWAFAPFFEIAIAVGLLSARARRLVVVGAIVMHVGILVFLGPFGFGHNQVIWPWNVAMVLLNVILFWPRDETTKQTLSRVRLFLTGNRHVFHKVVVVVFGVCPFLSYVGLWSPYLSFRMYSASVEQGLVALTPAAIDGLPNELREGAPIRPQEGRGFVTVHLARWGEEVLNAFPPPDRAVYYTIARRVCDSTTEPDGVRLILRHLPDLFTGERQETLESCAELSGGSDATKRSE